ncbi:MAG: InlB B-repeat-containing protein [Lachnospiraceae bacterium]|nr:InlB B-repeat-containing protein [Lachnospiraceae bacterium]
MTAAPADPVIEGMTFRGWYLSEDCQGELFAFGEALTEDLTLYADWTCDVTVVFGEVAGEALYYPEGSEWPESIFENDTTEYYQFTYSTQRVGEKLLDLVEPNYSEHVLTGWYLTSDHSGEAIDLSSYTLSGGITVYAHWEQIVSVTFDWNYGEAGIYSWIMGYLGWEIGYVPEDPQREHYTFTGWYTGKACVENQYVDVSSYLLTGDVTLYAGWTANEYEITYDLQGGENAAENPVSYTIESADITLADPTREGYTFEGWTGTDIEEALMEVVIPTGTTGTLSYTANWEPIAYPITYSLLRGSLTGEIPSTYTIEDADIVLPVPEKEGYIFEGWTGTDITEATVTVTIPAGSIGERSYTAVWSTTDSSAIIADNAIDAVEGDYTFELDDYIAGTDEASSVYQAARAALEEDAEAGLYAEEITLTLELAKADGTDDPVEDGIRYTWTFTATIAYTDDDGTVLEREGTVCAIVNKRVPTVTAPSASDLTYGAALSSSTLSGGSAAYEETDTDGNTTSVTVEGSFAWTDSAEVPKAADNGKEIYSVIFTPTDTANYAVVTVDLAVATQTGVHVYIESADSRYYIAATTQTSGTYTLIDADTGADLTSELTLSGGEYHFSQTAVETNVDVTFSGYTIADTETLPGGTVPKYGLMNAKTSEKIDDATGEPIAVRADILQVPFGDTTNTTISMNWPAANVTYGDTLTNNLLSGGSVSILYSYDYYSGSATAEGTWTWTETGLTATAAGEKICSVTFAPSDTASYAGGAADMTVTVAKKPVDAPMYESKVYDGTWNPYFTLPNNDIYKSCGYIGGYNAQEYSVTLQLKDPDNYTWSESARKNGKIDEEDETYLKVFYTVSKADFDVDVSGASVESLGYGQQLVSGTGTGIGTASRMISGTSITFNGEPVSGSWSWDLDSLTSQGLSQPLSVNNSGYTVDAVFNPSDAKLAINVNTVRRSFTVNVLQVTPDVSNANVTAPEVFQWGWTELDASTLSAARDAVNPNDAAMTVEGTWAWEVDNPEKIPYVEKDKTYTAVFTPGDTTNYTAAIAEVTVPVSEELTITFSRSQITGSTEIPVITLTLDDDNSEYVTDGYTKVKFKSKPDINKTSKVGLSVNLHNPAGNSSYKLGQYHIFSIEMTCDGTTYTHTLGNDQTLCCFDDRSEITILSNKMTVSSIGSFISGRPNLCAAVATFGFDWDQIKPTTGNITVHMMAELYEDGASSSNSLSQAASSGLMLSAIAETEAVTETVAEAETEAATEVQTEAAAEAQTSTEAQTEATTEAQKGTEAQTEAAQSTEAASEAQTEPAAETAVETQ